MSRPTVSDAGYALVTVSVVLTITALSVEFFAATPSVHVVAAAFGIGAAVTCCMVCVCTLQLP